MRRILIGLLIPSFFLISGCNKHSAPAASSDKIIMLLDWHPEPEFGGFYSALNFGTFKKHGIDATLQPTITDDAMWQQVVDGHADFATTSADQVLIARSQGAPVVAIFAVYQTCPQAVMVHKARGFKLLGDVFTHPGVLESDAGATWLSFCQKKYGTGNLKVIPDTHGIANFLKNKQESMQCFITSEPILAKASDPEAFLIADAGYNPYTTVVITTEDLIKKNPTKVKAVMQACREGWQAYLTDPAPANAVMGPLNKDMDAATFTAAAAAQKPLIETDQTRAGSLGMMTIGRWEELSKQLVELGVIKKPVPAKDCFWTGE